jgi:hypothetical protein
MTPGGRPAFAHLFTAEHKGLLLVALRCLGRIAGPQVADALHELSALWSQAVTSASRLPRHTHGT